MYPRKLSASVLAIVLSTAAFAMISWDVGGDQTSADSWGYSWTDSNAPAPVVHFSWVEISSTGTDAGFSSADNAYRGPFPIGFDFSFYGQTYTEFYISSNGFISFGSGYTSSSNYQMPYAWDSVHNIIAAYWDDLCIDDWPYNTGSVYYETVGAPPNSQLVVEYRDISRDYYYDIMTFEIILNETGEVWLQYLSLSGEDGSSATVGMENWDSSYGITYSHNQATLSNNLAIMFDEGALGFGPDTTNRAGWGSGTYYLLTVRNGQAFTDSFDIEVDYSYMGWTVTLYDEYLTPLADSNLNGIPDTGDIPSEGTVDFRVMVTVPDPPLEQNETTVLLASSFADPTLNDTVTLTTMASQAVFAPPHSDYGYDSDSDGDYDNLVVDVEFETIAGGYMTLYVYLYDSTESYIISFDYVYEQTGIGSVTISANFSGEDIYASLHDGPYRVVVYLYDNDGYYIGYSEFDTSSYLHTDFDEPVAVFSPPFTDSGRDDDANGLYDVLVLNISIEVFDAGYYSVYADLEDSYWGDWIASAEYSGSFAAGVHDIQLVFLAPAINQSFLDDTCEVTLNLYYYNSTWVSDFDYTTAHYVYTDFEGYPVEFSSPHDDYAEDTDSDGYYNHIVVTIYILCNEAGLYDFEAWVYDPWGYDFAYIFETVSFDLGVNEYVILLSSDGIYDLGRSGWYDFEMYLYDNSSSLLIDSEWYETDGYYYYWDFDPVGAEIDYMDDFARDTDSDGRYNEVVVTMVIDPLSSGYFEIEAWIDDYWYSLFDYVSEVVYLEEGVPYEYEIVLDGYDILMNGVQGSFYLEVYINDETGTYNYYYDWYYTSYYYLDDFDRIGAFFEGPHDDYGRDDDSDGLFDYLVFEIYLNASTSGPYDLGVDVWDYWGYYDYYWIELYLEADTITTVTIEIDSYSIIRNGVSGYWYLDMEVSDHVTSTVFDTDYLDSGYYYVSDFDPPGVMFDPPHDDYAYDFDGDSYHDYLVVEVRLDCTESGTYTITGDLYDDWGTYIATASETRSMNVGGRSVDLIYEGWMIEFNGESGWFEVDLVVEDSHGLELDYDTHYTDYYYYYDFDEPPAEFMPPHDDYAADTDDNGLFEFLIVNASIEVYEAGGYAVRAVLYDEYGDVADYARGEAYLDEGSNVIELCDDEGNIMGYSSHDVYGVYSQADFDPETPTAYAGWAYEPVAVDGTVSEGEWHGAVGVDVLSADGMNDVAATMYILNNDTHLFVLVDAVGDTTRSAVDAAIIGFDTGNDEVLSDGGEDRFAIVTTSVGYDTGHMVFDTWYWDWMADCVPFDDGLTDHEGIAGAAGFGTSIVSTTPHRIFEFCIPLALVALTPGDIAGFAAIPAVLDGGDDTYSMWPAYYEDQEVPLSSYGDLVLSQEPPLTTISLDGDEGLEGWFLSDVEVTLTATAGISGVNHTYYRVDGGSWVEYSTSFTVSEDALHAVEYYSVDVDGLEEPVRSAEVGIDTEAPESSASVTGTMGLGGWLVGEATITFDRNDTTSGVALTMYRLDDGDWLERAGDTLDIDDEGSHTLEYYTVDVAGNEEDVQSIDFRIDTVAPVTTASVNGSTVTLTVADASSGVSGTWYRMDGGDWTAYDDPFVVKGSGNHTVEYYSTDAAGNNETVKSVTVEGTSSSVIFGMDWWVLILIIALMAIIAIGAVFGMRRKARMADSRMVMKDQISAVSQMYEEKPHDWKQDVPQPPGEEAPPPPEDGK
jgi:hypothetical protein